MNNEITFSGNISIKNDKNEEIRVASVTFSIETKNLRSSFALIPFESNLMNLHIDEVQKQLDSYKEEWMKNVKLLGYPLLIF